MVFISGDVQNVIFNLKGQPDLGQPPAPRSTADSHPRRPKEPHAHGGLDQRPGLQLMNEIQPVLCPSPGCHSTSTTWLPITCNRLSGQESKTVNGRICPAPSLRPKRRLKGVIEQASPARTPMASPKRACVVGFPGARDRCPYGDRHGPGNRRVSSPPP